MNSDDQAAGQIRFTGIAQGNDFVGHTTAWNPVA
jgi:hypothetical protein